MQASRFVQTVSWIILVVSVTGCAASKEYTSKLFTPRVPVIKDSQVVALRFLNTDSADKDNENWVSTDIIMGRDTASKTYALDQLASIYPASPVTKDSSTSTSQVKTGPVVIAGSKNIPAESAPVAKNANPGEVRTKKTRED